MSARRKPLWRWEPSPYLLLFVFVLISGALQASDQPVLFGTALGISVIIALIIVLSLVMAGLKGKRNPDEFGNLLSLDGLTVRESESTTERMTRIEDTGRHRHSIAAATAYSDENFTAVLVPDATRWLARRYRVGVQLVAGSRVFHVGFLAPALGDELNALLTPLSEENIFVQVPAEVGEERGAYTVSLNISGVQATIETHNTLGSPSHD